MINMHYMHIFRVLKNENLDCTSDERELMKSSFFVKYILPV